MAAAGVTHAFDDAVVAIGRSDAPKKTKKDVLMLAREALRSCPTRQHVSAFMLEGLRRLVGVTLGVYDRTCFQSFVILLLVHAQHGSGWNVIVGNTLCLAGEHGSMDVD
jgi:hypothetical protein